MKEWFIVGMMIATMLAFGVLAFTCTVGLLLVGTQAMDLLMFWKLLIGSCAVCLIGLGITSKE